MFNYKYNSVNYSVNIAEGNYDAYEVATAISSVASGFSITYDEKTNKFTFTRTDYDFTILGTSTILQEIGLSGEKTSSGKSLTSNVVVDLATVKTVYVDTNFPTNNQTTDPRTTILAAMPVNSSYNGVIQYINWNNFKNSVQVSKIDTVLIRLLDQDFRELDLNGAHFAITLQIEVMKYQ